VCTCVRVCVRACSAGQRAAVACMWGGAGRVRQGRRNGLLPVHAMRSLTFVCVAGALLILSLVATGGFLPRAVPAPLAAVQRGPCNARRRRRADRQAAGGATRVCMRLVTGAARARGVCHLTVEASRGPVGLVAGAALVWCERMRGAGGALCVRVCGCACARAVLVGGQLLDACGGCGACASGPPEWLVACACHAPSHVRVCRRGFADSLSCYYGGIFAPCGASAAGRDSTRPV
jgi:hypothetical protein